MEKPWVFVAAGIGAVLMVVAAFVTPPAAYRRIVYTDNGKIAWGKLTALVGSLVITIMVYYFAHVSANPEPLFSPPPPPPPDTSITRSIPSPDSSQSGPAPQGESSELNHDTLETEKSLIRVTIDDGRSDRYTPDGKAEKVRLSVERPKPGYSTLILRVLIDDHNTHYSIDNDQLSWVNQYDSTAFQPKQIVLELPAEEHTLMLTDQYDTLYRKRFFIPEGQVRVKYFTHPYPYGPRLGRIRFIPQVKGRSRRIIVVTYNSDTVMDFVLRDRPVVYNLEESSYRVLTFPLEESPIKQNDERRIDIGAGHLKPLEVE